MRLTTGIGSLALRPYVPGNASIRQGKRLSRSQPPGCSRPSRNNSVDERKPGEMPYCERTQPM
jgi:hypothetical protein